MNDEEWTLVTRLAKDAELLENRAAEKPLLALDTKTVRLIAGDITEALVELRRLADEVNRLLGIEDASKHS